MKLFSQTLELRAIKSICYGSKSETAVRTGYLDVDSIDASSYLLGNLDVSFFHYEPCKAAYERVMHMLKKRSRILSFQELVEDLSLNEEYRDILSEYTKKALIAVPEAKTLVESLDKYRKARILYYAAKNVIDQLKSPEIDVDRVLDDTANRITEARTGATDQDPILTIGKDANALDLIDQALSMEDEKLLKTGFLEFDRRSGGLPSEGVFLIAATTSGGKSALRMNMMANMYKLNQVSVVTISFEQNEKKETRRFLSCITGIPFWKFNKKALSTEEHERCQAAWKKFHKYGKRNGCRYSIMCPTRGLNISQVLMLMKPYAFDVIVVDYVSLLDGVDEDNQPRMLKKIVRECKIFSGANKCLVVLLAQLDSEDGHIRYSKGMLEDADNSWVWSYSNPEVRDRKRLPIKQKKARDQEIFDFELVENFSHMQVLNPDEEIERAKAGSSYHRDKNDGNEQEQIDPLSDTEVEYAVD